MLTSKHLAETDVKMMSGCQECRQNHTDVVTRVVLHPSCRTTFPSPGWVHGNPSWVWKSKTLSVALIVQYNSPILFLSTEPVGAVGSRGRL